MDWMLYEEDFTARSIARELISIAAFELKLVFCVFTCFFVYFVFVFPVFFVLFCIIFRVPW